MPANSPQLLRTVPQPPPEYTGLTPVSIIQETESILARSNELRNQLTANISLASATFNNVIRPLVDDMNRATCRLNTLGTLLAEVSPDPLIRDASRDAQKLILAAESDNLMRKDVAALVAAVFGRSQSAGDDQLDAEDYQILSRLQSEFQRSGSTLQSDEERQMLREAQAELHELRIAAQKTLADSTGGVWFSRSELAGMTPKIIDSLRTRKDVDLQRSEGNSYFVSFQDEHATQMWMHVQSEASRRRYQTAFRRRFPQNVSRLARIVVLRDKIARILGFPNHASIKMEEKMARDLDEVQALLHDIWTRLEPVSKAEDEKLLELKRQELGLDEHARLHDWDWSYYALKEKSRCSTLDQEKLAEFFEVQHTWRSTLRTFERLFELEFHEMTGESWVWHESVRVYSVWDVHEQASQFLGYLYVDLFQRDGKYQNQHHVLIEPSFVTADGSHNHPSSALVCSFPEPSPLKPTLLQHYDVRTLFHELGHCIHNIVSTTKYAIPHSRDYIEIPSLLLEYWAWEPEVLMSIGRHYTCLRTEETGERVRDNDDGILPRSMLAPLMASRGCFGANAMVSMVQRSMFDLNIHSPASHRDAVEMDITLLWNTSRRDMAGQSSDPEDWGWEQAAFGHIFRKYDGGFFAYPLAKAYAADLYATVFKNDPLNPIKLKAFREQILQLGSSLPEANIMESFLGRKLDAEALFKEIIQNSCSRQHLN